MSTIKEVFEEKPGVWAPTKTEKSLWKRFIRQWDLQLMVLPAILFILLFKYGPMWGLLISFQEYDLFKGFFDSPWVGLKQFQMFFTSPDFWQVMRNTVVISLLRLVIAFPVPIILALLINEIGGTYFKKVIQTVTYLPYFISWVIVGSFVASLLSVDNGSVNILLQNLSLIKEPVNWLSMPEYFWGILITTGIWKDAGFSAIVYLAAIAGINPQLYEAASCDGAGRFKQITLVTVPCIMPVITIFFILALSNIMNAGFEDILQLTNNGNNGILRPISDVIDTFSYRVGLRNQRYSYAAATGFFKALINVGMLCLANSSARKLTGNSLW